MQQTFIEIIDLAELDRHCEACGGGRLSLVEEASDPLRVAEERVEGEGEAETEDGAGEERREDRLLLPLHLDCRARQEVARDRDERHEACNERAAASAVRRWGGGQARSGAEGE